MEDRGKKGRLGQARNSVSPKGNDELKKKIIRFCRDRGVDLVGFAPVERWDEAGEVPPEFRPRAIWPPAKTVMVFLRGRTKEKC